MLLQLFNVEKLLGGGGVGDASDDAANSLTAIYKNHRTNDLEKVVVSKYVKLRLVNNVADAWVLRARSMLRADPVWQGWVTEVEVITMIRQNNAAVTFYNSEGKPEIWRNEYGHNSMVSFVDHMNEFFETKLGWFRPLKWTFTCFDLLFHESENKLTVVKIIGSERHSCNLKSLIPFVQAINVYIIDFVFVCRRDDFSNFIIFDPEKHGKKDFFLNYDKLMAALQIVCIAQKKRTRDASAQQTFRKVYYKKVDSVRSTGLNIILT